MKNIAKSLAFAALLTAGAAHAEVPTWKLSESNGTVNILRAGVSKIAISGGSLKAGDVIATGKKSRAVLVRGQEYVVVSPNSRLRITEPRQDGAIMQFFEEAGNILFRIDKKATPHFGVKTPFLAAVVKGTTFSVTVSENGSAVQVTEGAVQVSTLDGGATELVRPGMIGMVSQDQQYRLTIGGAESRVIDSPNAPAIEKNDAPQTPDQTAAATEAPVAMEIAAGDFDGTISAPVSDVAVSLSNLTGGLVSDTISQAQPTEIGLNNSSVPAATSTGTTATSGTETVSSSNKIATQIAANTISVPDPQAIAAPTSETANNTNIGNGGGDVDLAAPPIAVVALVDTNIGGTGGGEVALTAPPVEVVAFVDPNIVAVPPVLGNSSNNGNGNENGSSNITAPPVQVAVVVDPNATITPPVAGNNGNGNGGANVTVPPVQVAVVVDPNAAIIPPVAGNNGNGNGNNGNANGNSGNGNGKGNNGNGNGNGGSNVTAPPTEETASIGIAMAPVLQTPGNSSQGGANSGPQSGPNMDKLNGVIQKIVDAVTTGIANMKTNGNGLGNGNGIGGSNKK